MFPRRRVAHTLKMPTRPDPVHAATKQTTAQLRGSPILRLPSVLRDSPRHYSRMALRRSGLLCEGEALKGCRRGGVDPEEGGREGVREVLYMTPRSINGTTALAYAVPETRN